MERREVRVKSGIDGKEKRVFDVVKDDDGRIFLDIKKEKDHLTVPFKTIETIANQFL